MKELRVAQSAGFCFGVNRSVGMAEKLLEDKGMCASLGQLIHNEDVVRELTSKGLRVIERADEARPGEDVLIARAEEKVRLVRLSPRRFFPLVREKLTEWSR